MSNLTYQKQQFLFTTIGPSQLATYTDKAGNKKLILKDKGIELVGGANAKVAKSVTDPSMKRIVILTQTKNAPASTSNVDYGFRVVAKFRFPGYVDNSEYWPHGKMYGGNYPNLSTFTDAQVLAMDNNILDLISADTGYTQNSSIPTGAIVNARRAYTVVDTDNSDASGFTITWPDGTTTVFATATTFADGELGTQLNADTTAAYGSTVKALLEAYKIDTNTFIITSRNPGLKFSIGTAVDTTISTPGIMLDSKYSDINYELEYDTNEWTAQGYNMTKITCSAFTSALNARVVGSGLTTTLVTATTNIGNVLTAFNAITGVEAIADGALSINVATNLSVADMRIDFPTMNLAGTAPLTASLGRIAFEGNKTGTFSTMTADDIQRIFAEADHAGFLRSAIRGNFNTVAGTMYTRFVLTGYTNVPALEGASHRSAMATTIEIFIPTEATRGDKWDASDNATGDDSPSGSVDITIDELLAYWAS